MSLNNFPDVRPSLLLHFAKTKRLDPRITFTRTTTATYYDGKTTAKAEENLLLQSQDFTTTWSGSNLTRTSNTGDTTAPDGTSTATKVDINATTGTAKWIRQDQTALPNVVLSFFLKAGTHGIFQIYAEGSSENFCNFDVGAGTVGSAGTNATGSIVSVGNSWYRCIVVFGSTAASRSYVAVVDSDTAGYGATTTVASADFYVWGAQREQRSAVSAYTPTTTAPITNYIPVLQTAASGVARFDHNPTTGESLGLLVEEQRTNLLTYSAEFDNAAWTKTNSSITTNTIVAPDGTLTGDKLVEDTSASATHNLQRSSSVTSGTSYTFSVYAKAAERTLIRISGGAAGFGSNEIQFNLSAGTATVTNGTPTASIVSVGNNWYRCAWTAVATASTTPNFFVYLDNGSAITYTGDGYSGIYLWGAQLEEGAFPTSYIATTSASVTRNADVASMTGTNFSSWYRADEGTLYCESEWTTAYARNNSPVFRFDDGTNNNFLQLGFRNVSPTAPAAIAVRVSGGTTYETTTGTVSTNDELPHKFAGAYTASELAFSADGESAGTATPVGVPVVNTARIGSTNSGVNSNYAIYVRKLSYYPSRLSDAQLQALTTV